MESRFSLIIFFFVSLLIHIAIIFYFKPSFFLFSNLQNIKLKQHITKVKLIKITPKPKPKIIHFKPAKPELASMPVIENPLPIKQKKVEKKVKKQPEKPEKNTTKLKILAKKKSKKIKSVKKKKKLKKIKEKRVDYSIIQKKVLILKKREEHLKKLEEERKLKEKLRKEAAVFYSKKLVSLIQSLWIFPSVIKDSELPHLKIKVKLRVRKDGKVIGKPVILEKSKNEIFNESALRAIEKLNEHKIPLPEIIQDKYIDLIITLTPPDL